MTAEKAFEIPYFIKVRGCINCDVSKEMKRKSGHDYGFDHELMAGCLLRGCIEYGHTIANPFVDPEEAVSFAKKDGGQQWIEGARKYCLQIKERFGKFYEKAGTPVDGFLQRLPEN